MDELSEIHNCKASEGKIVCISVDNSGVTHCAYCDTVVNYGEYYHNLFKENIPDLIKDLKEEHNQWLKQKKNLKRKKRRKKKKESL